MLIVANNYFAQTTPMLFNLANIMNTDLYMVYDIFIVKLLMSLRFLVLSIAF